MPPREVAAAEIRQFVISGIGKEHDCGNRCLTRISSPCFFNLELTHVLLVVGFSLSSAGWASEPKQKGAL